MTLLCADIGNSHTVLGLVDDGDVLDHWRVATDERRTADEWAVLLKGLLRESNVSDQVAGHRRVRDGARRCCTSGATCWCATTARCRTWSSSRACGPAYPC